MAFDPTELTNLAQRSGPFFFSVLYDVFISRWAWRSYAKVCERSNPPTTKGERVTGLLYFVMTGAFGLAITCMSVYWWVTHESVYRYTGYIRNLTDAEVWWGTGVYSSPQFGREVQDEGVSRDDAFIVFQNQPFTAGQRFVLNYQKKRGKVERLDLRYDPSVTYYRVAFDPRKEHNVLEPDDDAPPAAPPPKQSRGWSFDLIPSAYAQRVAAPSPRQQAAIVFNGRLDARTKEQLVAELQNTRVYVGSEIEALDVLARLSAADQQSFAETEGPLEPMIITLLDLTRHDDPELRYKAQKVMRNISADGIIRAKILDKKRRNSYLPLLLRIEPDRARGIVSSLGSAAMSDILKVADSIGKVQPRLIIGSASGDGDRFWVKGSSNSGSALACIQRAFEQRTDPVTSFQLAATPVVMEKGRATTYSYSKAWVLGAADGIEACHGRVGFGRTTLSRASQMRASGE